MDLSEKLAQAVAAYKAFTPEQRARHDHEQRRSFVRGMCPSRLDYGEWCKLVDEQIPPLTARSDAVLPSWRPIETAPKDREVLLYANSGVYIGKYRHGALMEPQQNVPGWRAYCCGKFTDPTYWMPLPAAPPKE